MCMERFSPSSEDFAKDLKDDDTSSTISESTLREQVELFEMIARINRRLLKEEECLVRLDANLQKHQKTQTTAAELSKHLAQLRTEMAKSACEMQHNNVVLEEAAERMNQRRSHLEDLVRELLNEEHEHEMLQALVYTQRRPHVAGYPGQHTKELLDTLV